MLRPSQALLVAAQMDTAPYRHLLGSLDTIPGTEMANCSPRFIFPFHSNTNATGKWVSRYRKHFAAPLPDTLHVLSRGKIACAYACECVCTFAKVAKNSSPPCAWVMTWQPLPGREVRLNFLNLACPYCLLPMGQ